MYSFSSAAGISSIFLSLCFIFKNVLSNITCCSVFWVVFLFSCSKINSSTEQTEANLPSAIFQSLLVFVQRLSGDILFSTFIHHKWNFIVRIGDWTSNSFSQWNFIIHAPDWLRAESVWILFTMIFVDKSQYLWNKISYWMV